MATDLLSRRSMFATAAAAALALPTLPTFAASFQQEELSFADLRTIYDALDAAGEAFLAIQNQPRSNRETFAFFEAYRDALWEQQDALIAVAKASMPNDEYESQIRAEILIRHAVRDDFQPHQIAELLSDWNDAPWRSARS